MSAMPLALPTIVDCCYDIYVVLTVMHLHAQACQMLQGRKRGQLEITEMITDMKSYKGSMAPFESPMAVAGCLVDMHWPRFASRPFQGHCDSCTVGDIPMSVTPDAADPEQAFMGRVQTPSCSRFKVSTVGAMAEIKSCLQLQPPEGL